MLTQQACSNLYHVALMAPPLVQNMFSFLHNMSATAGPLGGSMMCSRRTCSITVFVSSLSTTKSSISVPGGNPRFALCPLVQVWPLPPRLWMVNPLPQVLLSLYAAHTLLPAIRLWWTRKLWKCCLLPIPGHPFSPTLSMGVSSPPVFCGWPWRARILARTRHSPLARGSRTFHPYRTRPSWHPHNLLHPRVPPPSPFPCIARIRTSRPRCPCNWTGHAQRSFILNSCPAFASRLPLAASSPVIKCSTQCVASPIPSPADWLALAKPYNKCPALSHI